MALGDDEATTRAHARQSLVALGPAAVPTLLGALGDPDDDIRWEAAKALGEICDPATAPALVAALEDANSGVRWLAAEALIALGDTPWRPLLEALARRADSVWLREGAHHVLAAVGPSGLPAALAQVREALEGAEPALTLPLAARAALIAL